MKFEKIIAGFLAALMSAVSVVFPALAATQLGSFPGYLGKDGSIDAFVVVGADAKPEDVIAAADIAATLGSTLSYAVKAVPGAGVSGVTGLEKDGIALGTSSGGTDLATSTAAGSAFPSGVVLTNTHFSGLKDSTFSWRSNDYDYKEQVDLSGVRMRHAFSVSNINGTEKMEIQSGDVIYQYVFEKQLTGTGSTTSPNNTWPVNIMLLGKPYAIVGTGSNQVRVLQGSIGTADATTPVVYGDFSVYATQGSNNAWSKLVIKDKAGNTVDTLIINDGDTRDSSAASVTIKVTQTRALQDGTVVGSDIVVGATGTVDKTFDTSADTTSTGSASDRFPGETDWGIRVQSGDFATAGTIAVNDVIEVVYQPTETKYMKAGEVLKLPNNYGELGFVGFNTDKFATITIEPLSSTKTAYNYSADTQTMANLQGLRISSDVAGSIQSLANNGYNEAYVFVNTSEGLPGRVYVGFFDNSKQKILVNGTYTAAARLNATVPSNIEFVSYDLGAAGANNWFTYPFRLNYGNSGDQSFWLNVTIHGNRTDGGINSTRVNRQGSTSAAINFTYTNITSVGLFKLGASQSSSEDADIVVVTEGGAGDNVGKATQDIVTDAGIIVKSPASSTASDKVQLLIPAKDLGVHVYFGTKGAVAGAAGTYNEAVPVTSAIALLDKEVTSAHKAKHIVTVGGPCVNRITAEALGLTYPACGTASTIPENKAVIQVLDDKFATGKTVTVVAGWAAENTRTAASVLQQYATLLKGQTASKVVVTSATSAGITAA